MTEFERVIQELRDAMTVTASMSLRQESRVKEHEEWLRSHELAIANHDAWRQEHEAAMRELDRKLDRISDLISKGHGGNGQS